MLMTKRIFRMIALLLACALASVMILGGAAAEDPAPGDDTYESGGETPVDDPDSGDEPDPGDDPDPGDEPDPGADPDPGDEPDPGDDPDPGNEPDPGNKPDSGDKQDSGNEPEQTDDQGEFPGGMQGGRRGGFGRRGGNSEKQPGEPLIADHSRGTGDMTLYGTVNLKEDGKQIRELILDNESVGLGCEDGTFMVSLEGDTMILTAEEETEWYMSQFSLLTLNRSGISRLVLRTPEGETALDTDVTITGRIYGQERSAGFVTDDFILRSRRGQWTVSVEDRIYLLEQGELKIPDNTQEEKV